MNELKEGVIIKSGNFMLKKRIRTFEEFWHILNIEKSVFARHKMYPTSFFFSWQIRLIMSWIDQGYFWTTERLEKDLKDD